MDEITMSATNITTKKQYLTDEQGNKIAVVIEINGYQQFLKESPKLTESETTLGDLLQFAGTWQGDDLKECLDLVYQSRSHF
jgi:hypothetical protein